MENTKPQKQKGKFVDKSTAILAWHFCAGWKLRDGQPLVVGQSYHVDGPLVLCERGLHGSIRAIDALRYAPGATVCRVELFGKTIIDDDKIVATDRRVIAAVDATRTLHEFACCVAEQTLGCYGNDDPRSWAAIEAKRNWLAGQITDAQLAAAGAAAGAAAWDAARAAAWDAAWAAQANMLRELIKWNEIEPYLKAAKNE